MLEAQIAAFGTVERPRCAWEVGHRLLDILVIAVCAVPGEAESFEDVALHGRCRRRWPRGFLALPGVPSHETFRRVLMLVDGDAFERPFLGRVRAAFRPEEGAPRQVALDGETVRHSSDLRKGRSPLHLVGAYATEGGIVPAQRATETKGGGLAGLPGLLDGLDLAEWIVSHGDDYLVTLKGSWKETHAEAKARFAANAFALGAPLRPCFDASDDGHGRLVRRRVLACADLAPFTALRDRPGLATVVVVETIRGIPGRGEVEAEIRHHLSSARLPPEALVAAIRNHQRSRTGSTGCSTSASTRTPAGCASATPPRTWRSWAGSRSTSPGTTAR